MCLFVWAARGNHGGGGMENKMSLMHECGQWKRQTHTLTHKQTHILETKTSTSKCVMQLRDEQKWKSNTPNRAQRKSTATGNTHEDMYKRARKKQIDQGNELNQILNSKSKSEVNKVIFMSWISFKYGKGGVSYIKSKMSECCWLSFLLYFKSLLAYIYANQSNFFCHVIIYQK